MTLTLIDESLTGDILNRILIQIQDERLTVKDLIQARVYQEVETYNQKLPEHFAGLVQPSDAERELNGYRMRTPKPIDPEKQTYVAWDAFARNGFFILIDDRQAEELDQEVLVSEQTRISFVKLTPLVGG